MIKGKKLKSIEIIKKHIVQNYKEYAIIIIFFIIGIFLGVFFVNNTQDQQRLEIHNYLNEFIEKLKNGQTINLLEV